MLLLLDQSLENWLEIFEEYFYILVE